MTIAFDAIAAKFDRVFGFMRRDLERILTLDPGGNFAVATLVACACETLARCRFGSAQGTDVFSQLLPSGPHQRIAKTLYDLVRNGFVHRYDVPDIRVDGTLVRIAISWRGREHLAVLRIDDVPNLILNVTILCRDLFSLFDEYREELKTNGEARDRFFMTYRQVATFDVPPGEVAAWQEILQDAGL